MKHQVYEMKIFIFKDQKMSIIIFLGNKNVKNQTKFAVEITFFQLTMQKFDIVYKLYRLSSNLYLVIDLYMEVTSKNIEPYLVFMTMTLLRFD